MPLPRRRVHWCLRGNRIAVATREALRFNAGHRHRPDRLLDFEPIAEGTVIFLNDLLFGTLRGRPFLDQKELLMPYFPDGVAVWRGCQRRPQPRRRGVAGRSHSMSVLAEHGLVAAGEPSESPADGGTW